MKLRKIEFAEFDLDAEKLTLKETDFDASDGISAESNWHDGHAGPISYLVFKGPDDLGWPYSMPISIRLPAGSPSKAQRIAAAINAILSEPEEAPLANAAE